MKNIFYALCPLPVACLLISFLVPADTHATSPAARHPFDWLMLAIIGSPILALYGFACIAANHSEGKSVRDPAIATAVAALVPLPGFHSPSGNIQCFVVNNTLHCALARAVKRSGGTIWMGLTRASQSLRSYEHFSHIRDMIARTAFTQLRYSPILLAGTLVAMILTFVLPLALTFSANIRVWPFALAAWCLMTASFLPTVTCYRLRAAHLGRSSHLC